ncbi:MAG: tyrosine-type recombinase/integrase, partial [Symploca sp. SIO3C6]|nr:tyrosine-type recombinase/integrase [Symploca sp. SIO3C6]
VQFNACCKWATKSNLLDDNPFAGMANEIKKTVRDTSREAFSLDEMKSIIEAFATDRYSPKYAPVPHSYYTAYVRFLLATGCRPEEAVALKWQHIAPDCTRIYFNEAVPSDTKIRGNTKTQKARHFPCNQSLQNLLKEIKPEEHTPEQLVLPAPRGKVIDYHNFLNRIWSPVVEALASEGEVERYLPQYNIRHTFITLALEHGMDAKDVARLVGNSPEIIYRHYAGNKRELFVPEF